MEIWKPVPEFSNYIISNYGLIKNIKTGKFSELSSIDRSGFYRKKMINDKGKDLTRGVHKLVAEAFVDNPHGYTEVIPIDGNKLNVVATNLKWGTRADFYKVFPKKVPVKKYEVFNQNDIIPGERWKDIPDADGYKISDLGRYFNPSKGIKICDETKDGNITLNFKKDNKIYYRRVHQIIGELFVEKNENKHLIFIDGNKLNVKYTNLKWVTWDEKAKHEKSFNVEELSMQNIVELDPLTNEVWKTITDYDNYEVSSFGRVRNKNTGHIKNLQENSDGKYKVNLWKNNKGSNLTVHRLVVSHFLSNEENKKFVIFADGDLSNLKLSNLNYSDVSGTYNIRIDHKIEQYDEFGLINVWESFKDILNSTDITYKELNRSCAQHEPSRGFYWRIYIEIDLEGEIWKPCQIDNEIYEVSNKGRIRNEKTKRHLSPSVRSDGYINVGLKGKLSLPVHRLVGTVHVTRYREDQNEINHIDGNKQNNSAENLEWCTGKENMQHASDNNLIPRKSRSPRELVDYIEGEIWKEIDKHPEYKISNLSRISKNDYLISSYTWVYPRVKLNGKNFQVHRLLAESFIPNPNNLPVVNHKDGNKENKSLDNLEWVTYSENTQHANDTELIKYPKSQRIDQYTLDGVYIQTWPSISKASKNLNINKYTIIKCLRGTFQTAGLHRWKYNDMKN